SLMLDLSTTHEGQYRVKPGQSSGLEPCGPRFFGGLPHPPIKFKPRTSGPSRTVASGDPNPKFGPAGFGPPSFPPPDPAFPYRIDFENDPKATAPAQRVVVTDQLDANLDWNTFTLTGVGFGDTNLEVPPGSQHFQTTVPISFNGQTFNVEIELGLNAQTGS